MKNYYEAIKQYITKYLSGNSKRMKELEDVKNDQKELIKLYNDYKRLSNSRNEPIDESSKMTKSKFKEYIKEIITNTLNESGEKTALITTQDNTTTAVDYKNPEELKKIGDNLDVKQVKTGTGQKLKELEPDSKQYRKVANRELAFLAKQVRSLEKQLKSQGSDENKG